jgi:hypothetical protein
MILTSFFLPLFQGILPIFFSSFSFINRSYKWGFMLNVRNTISEAYLTGSLVGEGEIIDGAQTQIGVNELNDILHQYNLDNYFPFTRNTITSAFGASQTEYTIGLSGCDITAEVPILISKVLIRTSSQARMNELKRVSYEDIWAFKSVQNATGIPVLFSYDRTWPNGRLVFDINPQPGSLVTLIYNKPIPEVTINSILDIPNEYNDLLKNTLAGILMRRWKMDTASIVTIEEQAKQSLDKIKKRNNIDKIISYSGNMGGGSTANYYNLMSPRGW